MNGTLISVVAVLQDGLGIIPNSRVVWPAELVRDPHIIFLDEPTSGLDSETAAMLIETIVQLARRNRTVSVYPSDATGQ
jgi:ABC-type Mn2+/Zn2+ transport system ATPase subunit